MSHYLLTLTLLRERFGDWIISRQDLWIGRQGHVIWQPWIISFGAIMSMPTSHRLWMITWTRIFFKLLAKYCEIIAQNDQKLERSGASVSTRPLWTFERYLFPNITAISKLQNKTRIKLIYHTFVLFKIKILSFLMKYPVYFPPI